MKLVHINGATYVKSWGRLYYLVFLESGVPVLIRVKVAK